MEANEKIKHLEGFAELIKAGPQTQNMCVCSEILTNPSNQSMILRALANNAHHNSKLAVETGDEFYINHAEANRELYRKLAEAFGLDDYAEN